MLIEQVIEFKLRGPGPPDCTRTSTTGYFYNKTKISRENLRLNLLLKYCTRQCTFPLPGPNHLHN